MASVRQQLDADGEHAQGLALGRVDLPEAPHWSSSQAKRIRPPSLRRRCGASLTLTSVVLRPWVMRTPSYG